MEAGTRNMKIESLTARDGNSYLNLTIGENVYRLNSNYRPLAEAQKWAEGQDVTQSGAVVLMFGIGNGYCARALLARMQKNATMLLWEPSAAVYEHEKAEKAIQELAGDERVHMLVQGINEREIFALLDQKLSWSNAKKQILCIHPQYDKAFPEELAFFEELIRSNNVRIYTNRNTEMVFGAAIAENTAFNLRYVPEAFLLRDMIGKFPKDVPAIIVAAGPSLDKNIEELKRAKGKAVIVATDTALRALTAHNITPDFAVILDAQKPPSYFKDEESHRIPLFAKIQANREVLVLHEAEKIWYDSHEYLNAFYERLGRKPRDYHAGGSVATAAFSICSALGFRRIVLIGQDLAYQGNVTHAGGQVSGIRHEEDNICYIDGVNGEKVRTRHDWVQYLKWFERVIAEVQNEIEVIDATEGGALIHGTVLMPLAEVIDRYCRMECDAYQVMKESCRGLSAQERKTFSAYVRQSIAEAEQIKQLAEQVRLQCAGVQAQLQRAGMTEEEQTAVRRRIARAGEQLQQMQLFLLIDDYTKQVSIPAITEAMEAEGTEAECFAIYIESVQKTYTAFSEAVDVLTILLQEAENGGAVC